MKIAITSKGNSLQSFLDQRFARCTHFVIFDTDTGSTEFLPNPNVDFDEGAGPAAVELMVKKNVRKIISGEFGQKIKPMLDSLRIQMIVLKKNDKKIQDIIDIIDC
jgi:predicted Fe-Mo cluster-binding NifX family protein